MSTPTVTPPVIPPSQITVTRFKNQFRVYTIPASAYVDPGKLFNVLKSSCPEFEALGIAGTVNVNNAMGFEQWAQNYANAEHFAQPLPSAPKYWDCTPDQVDAYWNGVTKNDTGFDSSVLPSAFNLPNGVGGPFIPA